MGMDFFFTALAAHHGRQVMTAQLVMEQEGRPIRIRQLLIPHCMNASVTGYKSRPFSVSRYLFYLES
jgi:hypothetical protein